MITLYAVSHYKGIWRLVVTDCEEQVAQLYAASDEPASILKMHLDPTSKNVATLAMAMTPFIDDFRRSLEEANIGIKEVRVMISTLIEEVQP